MGDLFCEAIPNGWINAIIGTALVSKHFIFMFYTKNPARYRNFIFPENCWLGTSIDYSHNYQRIEQLKQYKNSNVKKFVSIEPLLSSMAGVDFTGTDFVFVGAQTGAGAKPPKNDWINSIKHPQIYYKDNILKYLQNEKTTIYS
jgi:protein gp37